VRKTSTAGATGGLTSRVPDVWSSQRHPWASARRGRASRTRVSSPTPRQVDPSFPERESGTSLARRLADGPAAMRRTWRSMRPVWRRRRTSASWRPLHNGSTQTPTPPETRPAWPIVGSAHRLEAPQVIHPGRERASHAAFPGDSSVLERRSSSENRHFLAAAGIPASLTLGSLARDGRSDLLLMRARALGAVEDDFERACARRVGEHVVGGHRVAQWEPVGREQ